MPLDRTGNLDNTHSAYRFAKVAKSDSVDFAGGPARALWVGTAGTANLVDLDDVLHANFPLKEGPNPIMCKRINLGGTADDIWAIHE